MMKSVEHLNSGLFMTSLECGPVQGVKDEVDSGDVVVSVLSLLYGCHLQYILCRSQTVAEYSSI